MFLSAMHVLFFMIGVSLLMALGFLAAFFWAMRSGQQDDLYTPSLRMLLDEEKPPDGPAGQEGAAPPAFFAPQPPPHSVAPPHPAV